MWLPQRPKSCIRIRYKNMFRMPILIQEYALELPLGYHGPSYRPQWWYTMFSTSPEHHGMFWKVSRNLRFFEDFSVLCSYLIHSGAPESPPGLVTIQVKVTEWLYVIHTLCTSQLLQCEMISNTFLKAFSVWMFLLFILIHLTTFRRLSGEKICNGSNVGRYRCRIWYIDNIFSWKNRS